MENASQKLTVLSSALHPTGRWQCVVHGVYGDESSDESKARVFAVAGVFGAEDDWKELREAWSARTGGRVFHATDCDTDQGEFANSSHSENKSLYKDLVQIACHSKVLGRATAIDLIGWNKLFPGISSHVPYFICFREVVHRCGEIGRLSMPQDTIKFTFHRHQETEYNAGVLYDYMTRVKDWKASTYLHDEISFASSKEIGIQIADLIARETMKHLDNIVGPVKRETRRSMAALQATYKFGFRYYTEPYFA